MNKVNLECMCVVIGLINFNTGSLVFTGSVSIQTLKMYVYSQIIRFDLRSNVRNKTPYKKKVATENSFQCPHKHIFIMCISQL